MAVLAGNTPTFPQCAVRPICDHAQSYTWDNYYPTITRRDVALQGLYKILTKW